MACDQGHLKIVQILIKAGANLNLFDVVRIYLMSLNYCVHALNINDCRIIGQLCIGPHGRVV